MTTASAPVVLVDANVLYSAALRDLVVELFLTDTIQVHWSADILAEVVSSLSANRRATVAGTQRLVDDLTRHFPQAAVDPSPVPTTVTLPDPSDHHVLGAAIAAGADTILTFNVNDFPPSELAKCGSVRAKHPDTFLQALFSVDEYNVLRALAQCRRKLVRSPISIGDHIDHLERCQLIGFAAVLRSRIDTMET